MDEDLRRRVISYRVAMSIIRGLVLDSTISEEEYVRNDTIIAQKYGLNSSTIFRKYYWIYTKFRGNMSH